MILKLLLARASDWFKSFDPALNPYLFSISLLKRLEKRKIHGIIYDRLEIIVTIGNRTSFESIKTLNSAITLLFSRNLINIVRDGGSVRKKILITEKGINFLEKFKTASNKNENK